MWQRHPWISDKIMACTHYENCSCDVEIGGNFFDRLMIDLISARPKPFSPLHVTLFEKAISDCAPRFKMSLHANPFNWKQVIINNLLFEFEWVWFTWKWTHVHITSCSYPTKTRFGTEATGNSEMVRFVASACMSFPHLRVPSAVSTLMFIVLLEVEFFISWLFVPSRVFYWKRLLVVYYF